MGHTYTNLLTHLVFSTKDRLPYIQVERRDDVFAYIVNGAADHVHALIRLPAALAVAKAAEIIKRTLHDGFTKIAFCIARLPGRRGMRHSA
jgi:REP element-mobilizing transposase RayT